MLLLALLPGATGMAFGQGNENYDTISTEAIVDTLRADDDGEYDDEAAVKDEEAFTKYFKDRDTSVIFAADFQQRRLPDSLLKSFSRDESFWYANEVFEKKKVQPNKEIETSGYRKSNDVFETFLWILIIALFIGIIIVFLQGNKVWLFRSQSRKISQLEEEAELSDDIFAIPFQRELEKAVQAGNFRLAVRLHFLQLLRKLADKRYIKYEVDKTNFDYLMELHQSSLYQGFFKLTRAYEFTWYGKFEVDREKYDLIREEFQVFEKDIR